jgi:hypothetical protein
MERAELKKNLKNRKLKNLIKELNKIRPMIIKFINSG